MERLAEIGDGQSDELRAAGFHGAGGHVNAVSEAFDGILDTLARLRAHTAGVVQHIRHRFDGDARLARHVGDGHPFRHSTPLVAPSGMFRTVQAERPSDSSITRFPRPSGPFRPAREARAVRSVLLRNGPRGPSRHLMCRRSNSPAAGRRGPRRTRHRTWPTHWRAGSHGSGRRAYSRRTDRRRAASAPRRMPAARRPAA